MPMSGRRSWRWRAGLGEVPGIRAKARLYPSVRPCRPLVSWRPGQTLPEKPGECSVDRIVGEHALGEGEVMRALVIDESVVAVGAGSRDESTRPPTFLGRSAGACGQGRRTVMS